MPYIRCDVQQGLSDDQKARLADAIVKITHEKIGSPMAYIHVSIRDWPGNSFVESGKRNLDHKNLKSGK